MENLFKIENIYPKIIGILLLLLTFIPNGYNNLPNLFPEYLAIFIFYWTIYYPRFMPAWFVFVLGILIDIIYSTPIGFTSIIYLMFRTVLFYFSHRFKSESFLTIWQFFAVSFILLCLTQIYVYNLILDSEITISANFLKMLSTISIYPLLHYLFNITNKPIIEQLNSHHG